MAVDYIFLVRGDTAEHWEGRDSLLKNREIGYDQTNRRFKVGDGTTTWKNLPYVKPDVIDDLLTGGTDAALSAEQGKELKRLVDGCADDIETINQNISNLEQNITQIVKDSKVKVVDKLESANSGTDALSAKQGWVLKTAIDGKASSSDLTTLETTLTQFIEDNKVKVVDKLENTNSGTDALSAKQGWVLKGLIDGKTSVAVVNSVDANKVSVSSALSSYQGYFLNYWKVRFVEDIDEESWTFELEDGTTTIKTVALWTETGRARLSARR